MTDAPVTAAQETITTAILASFVACVAASLAIIDLLSLTSPNAYTVFALASFVISGYLVPNLTAYWIGQPLHLIMRSDPPA
jgi:hypothetical protein